MSHWCRWEYRTLVMTTPDGRHDANPPAERLVEQLNALGADGWEAYLQLPGIVYLKRQQPVMPAAQHAPSRPMPPLVRGALPEEVMGK